MKSPLCGRADLIRVLASERSDILHSTARLLGLEPAPDQVIGISHAVTLKTSIEVDSTLVKPSQQPSQQPSPLADVPFWRVEVCEFFEIEQEAIGSPSAGPVTWTGYTGIPPDLLPLARWSTLLPHLRRVGTTTRATRHVDIKKTVNHLSRGETLHRLPRQGRRSWGQRVQIIIDRSDRLIPYWGDQISIRSQLKRLFPRHNVEYAIYYEGLNKPILTGKQGSRRDYSPPVPGGLVVVLGDLGCLSRDKAERDVWTELGRRLRNSGCLRLAIIPCPQACVGSALARSWRMLPWERTAGVQRPPSGDEQVGRLLSLVSPAVRVEPGFLREVRRLMGADACIESYAWQHPAVVSASSVAATLDPSVARELRARFEQEPDTLRVEILALLRRWRSALPQEIWFEEIRSLSRGTQALLSDQSDLQQARQFFIHLSQAIGEGNTTGGTHGWIRRLEQRIEKKTWLDPEIGPALYRLWWATHAHEADIVSAPPGYDPRNISTTNRQSLRTLQVLQRAARLEIVASPESGKLTGDDYGSWLGQLQTRNGQIVVKPLEPQFWKEAKPPTWASDWGEDQYGHWVEFSIDKGDPPIVQRMRWIRPGRFLMGSPGKEPDRWDDEGPQHRVTISQGFWLCNTPCTQDLWQTVMGENTSHFRGADRPVENVSWDDCQGFLEKLNGLLPGLNLSLPNEAQWEYACRAMTQTPFSFGDRINPDQANYDGNYPYAGGEKGAYREETVPVDRFVPNPWGLYQMHGNVDEWCADGMRGYSEKTEIDPVGPMKGGVERVVRGGSWGDDARDVRSAFRDANDPGDRLDYLGFRCARVQAGAEPADSQQSRSAEQRRSAANRSGTAVLLQLRSGSDTVHSQWPDKAGFSISTDVGRLTLRNHTRPAWAAAIGRDHYGLWTELEIEASGGPKITQRLRWIPPGRFLMGSTLEESGRRDGEGPRHQVTLSRGYWLFDTPVTQALWEVVSRDNPSKFRSPQRPVENVSWHQAQDFIERINDRITGLNLMLPSESQWEYACRAGTQTATFAGDLEMLGESNAPLLDDIAWYGGNSGVDFDLKEGWDSSSWKEKQYAHERAGTRKVALKVANAWGLYDMLGNVWEWCLDGQREYRENSELDPLGSLDDGVLRVVRGGSWNDIARDVRSASRLALVPGIRFNDLGFRCARVHEGAGWPCS